MGIVREYFDLADAPIEEGFGSWSYVYVKDADGFGNSKIFQLYAISLIGKNSIQPMAMKIFKQGEYALESAVNERNALVQIHQKLKDNNLEVDCIPPHHKRRRRRRRRYRDRFLNEREQIFVLPAL